MSSDLYAQAKSIFQRAMEQPAAKRSSYVDGACGDNEELKREVKSWIGASDKAGESFLDSPTLKMCVTCEGSYTSETKFCPHCGQVLQEDPRALVGTRLDNMYQIEDLLGTGGMGAVYRARHSLLGDKVAIKTLKRELSDNPTFLRRFQREGKAARAFQHPNAVTVHDLRTTPAGLIYMVLEYIDGPNLRKVLNDRGRLSCTEAVEILEPIASVIDAAHHSGVVHRDLKPENVMVATDEKGRPHVKVLDLGIAKLREAVGEDAATELTAFGTLLGTPHYMSPEQWGVVPADGKREIDGRTDVYSMGVMAYEMVTGHWPYYADSVDDYHKAHTTDPIPYAHATCPDVPARFSRAVARAMAKDRAERFSVPSDFVAELKEAALEDPGDVELTGSGALSSRNATVMYDATATQVTPGGETQVPQASTSADAALPRVNPIVSGVPASATQTQRGTPRWLAWALAVVLVGIAGWYLWGFVKPSTVAPAAGPPVSAAPTAVAATDVLRFSIEVKSRDGNTSLVSGQAAIGTVDGYRFVFTPSVAGRIAVIGPNTRNVPTLFLSTSGGTPLEPGKPIVFPANDWFHTTAETPSDTVTIVFLPDPAVVPAFAAGSSGHQLSVDEQRDLEVFRTAHTVAPRAGDTFAVLASKGPGGPVLADVTVRY